MSVAGIAKQPRPIWGPLEVGCLAALTTTTAVVLLARQSSVEALMAAGWFAVLSALAWLDLRERRIPNAIIYPAFVAAVAALPLWPGHSTLSALLGGGIALAIMLPIYVIARGGLGAGDVKMAGLAGILVGAGSILPVLFVAATLCGLSAVALLLTRRAHHSSALPLGFFLALMTTITMLH